MKAKPLIIAGIIVGGLVTAYVAVRKYYLQQIDLLKDMDYQLIGFNYGKASMDLLEVLLTLRLHSKSAIDAEILDFYADLLLNGVKVAEIKLGKEKLQEKMQMGGPGGAHKNILPAKGYSDIRIEIDVLPKEITGNAWDLIKSYISTKDVSIRLDNGKVKVKVGWIKKEIDFSYATTWKEIMQP